MLDDDPGDPRIQAARAKAFLLYEGRRTPHRSCGIALAETFGMEPAPYQALRRGGLTGCGECGAVIAGRLVLGQLFGDPDPTGGITDALLAAARAYEAGLHGRMDRGQASESAVTCNALTAQFAAFHSPERAAFCTRLAADIAETVAEVAVAGGAPIDVTPIEGLVGLDPEPS